MRALLGPIVAHGALLAAGFGVLRLLGVVPSLRSRRALAAAGLAYLIGIAATLGLCLIVLVAGGPFTLPVVLIVAALLASPLVWWRRAPVGGASAPESVARGLERYAVAAMIVALCALALVALLTVGDRPLAMIGADTWNQWMRKALLLFYSPHLPSAIFSFSGDLQHQPHYNINPSYPLLLPMLYATHLRALGRPDPDSAHIVVLLLAIAFVWAGAFIASRVTAAIVWAPVLAAATLLTITQLLTGYADIPLGYYLALGTLQLGIWLQSRRRADLAVATLLLLGAAGTKDEGTVEALIVLGAALAVTFGRRAGVRDVLAAAAALIAIGVLPWRLWVTAHNLQTENPLGRVADPVYLVNHITAARQATGVLAGRLTSLQSVTAFALIALAMAAVAIFEPGRRPLGTFYLAAGFGYFIALVWSFWTSILPVSFLAQASAPRIVMPLGLLGVAAVLHLSTGHRDRTG
jgi:hypothetical protein